MAEAESRTEKWAAGTTALSEEVNGKIVEFLWWMRKEGYKESTIVSRGSRLKRLVKLGADLFDPESVKEVIAKQEGWSEGRKEAMVYAYDYSPSGLGLNGGDRSISQLGSCLSYL